MTTQPLPLDRKERVMPNYLHWLKARIAEAEASGELHLIDPRSIERAWAEREA
jgi:hypothetical protein